MSTTNHSQAAPWIPSFLTEVNPEARAYFNLALDARTPVDNRMLNRRGYHEACVRPRIANQDEGARRELATIALDQIARDGASLDYPDPRYGIHSQMRQAAYTGVTETRDHVLLTLRAWELWRPDKLRFVPQTFDEILAAQSAAHPSERASLSAAVAYVDLYMSRREQLEAPQLVEYRSSHLRASITLGAQVVGARVQYPEFQAPLMVGMDSQRLAELSAFLSCINTAS